MRTRYTTAFGENICVVGSIPELGNWKQVKCQLRWTEGHIWETEQPIYTSQPYFTYKYVLMQGEELVKWEDGLDRIADL